MCKELRAVDAQVSCFCFPLAAPLCLAGTFGVGGSGHPAGVQSFDRSIAAWSVIQVRSSSQLIKDDQRTIDPPAFFS